jgi:hypothetical protein
LDSIIPTDSARLQIVLSVVIGNFTISLPAGPQTNIESGGGRIPQPRVFGQGTELLMVVQRL